MPSAKNKKTAKTAKTVKVSKTPISKVGNLHGITSASSIVPVIIRSNSIPFEQKKSDCIQKAHSRLLSNYFCYLLSENNRSIINKITVNFDKALNKYAYEESPVSIVKGYGGDLNDVLGQVVNGLKNITNIKQTIYKDVFNDSQKTILYNKLHQIAIPDTEYEDNSDVDPNTNGIRGYLKPGNCTQTISEFCSDSIKYDPPHENIFVSYFCVSILLVPCFYYWFSRLDNTNIYNMDTDLKNYMIQEVQNVYWMGTSPSNGKYEHLPNAEKLTTYLTGKNLFPLPANSECFGWEGHEIVVKGYTANYNSSGIACYFIQNSWGANWNKTPGTCAQSSPSSGRWISADVLNNVVYGVSKIVFPGPSEFTFGKGITKRKRKPISKKINKSSKTRRL
jgi:hypothetical protein